MKNGKHTTLFVILLFLTNLFASSNLFSNTILAIQVENGSNNSIGISCLEEVLSEKKWQKNLDLQVSKHYVLDIDLKAPKVFQISCNGSDYEIYLEPNDSLVLHINGKYFPHQLNIQGIGKERNVLLYNFYEKFEADTKKKTLEKMYTCKSAAEYRKFVDAQFRKKWSYFHQIYPIFRQKSSTDFEHFVNVKFNFWRANMLMQLVDENNSILSNLKYEIPNEYFSFLDELIMEQNDMAMEVNDYRDFLKSYADFRLKKMNFPYGIVSKNQILEVTEPKLAFYTSENCANMLGILKKNDKIIIKDVLTFGEDKVYRFKAQTTDGRAGWFKMQGVAYLKPAIAEKELELSQYTVDYKRTSIIYVAKVDSLVLFADPDDQENSLIQLLMTNQRLIPLDETTIKTYVNRYAGVNYNGTMSKVRTQDGVMGWVNSLLLAEVKTYQSYQDDLTVVNQDPFVVNSLDYFFSDKSLYFVKANILKNDIEFNGKSKLKLALDAYKKSCKSPEYLTAFEAMLKQTKKKYDVDSLSYDAKYSFVKSEKLNLLPNKSFESNFLEHNIPNYEDQLKSEKKIKIFLAYIEMEAEKYVLKQPKDMKKPSRKTDVGAKYEKLKIEFYTSNSSSLALKPDK